MEVRNLQKMIELLDTARSHAKASEADVAEVIELDPLVDEVKQIQLGLLKVIEDIEWVKKQYETDALNIEGD